MKTWKQGVVGVISLSESETVYLHCHKYPCALFYREYNPNKNTLESYLFTVMVGKEVLKYINRIGTIKLNKEEKRKSESFLFHSREERVEISRDMSNKVSYSEKLYSIKEIEEKYYKEKN
jgi:hypothetical protein